MLAHSQPAFSASPTRPPGREAYAHSREKTRIIEHVSTSTIHEKKEVISKTPPPPAQ